MFSPSPGLRPDGACAPAGGKDGGGKDGGDNDGGDKDGGDKDGDGVPTLFGGRSLLGDSAVGCDGLAAGVLDALAGVSEATAPSVEGRAGAGRL